jgi:hypothetical protein
MTELDWQKGFVMPRIQIAQTNSKVLGDLDG